MMWERPQELRLQHAYDELRKAFGGEFFGSDLAISVFEDDLDYSRTEAEVLFNTLIRVRAIDKISMTKQELGEVEARETHSLEEWRLRLREV